MKKNDTRIIWVLVIIVILVVFLIFKDKIKWVSGTTATTTDTARTATELLSYSGTSTHNGTGTATSFSVPHLLGQKPTFVQITPTSTDAAGYSNVVADAKLITVYYNVAPVEGTNNVTFNWFATL